MRFCAVSSFLRIDSSFQFANSKNLDFVKNPLHFQSVQHTEPNTQLLGTAIQYQISEGMKRIILDENNKYL